MRARAWRSPSVRGGARALLALACAMLPAARAAEAQETVAPAVQAAIARARTLLESGEGAAARTLLDSLVGAQGSGSANLAEALFWRATLSERASDAELDWKRLAIEAPLSARTPDALVRLGELELLRGRTASARTYFERAVRDFPDAPQRVKSTLWIARSWFDDRDVAKACGALGTLAGVAIPAGELTLQREEMGKRCSLAGTANSVSANSASAVGDRRDSVRAGSDRLDAGRGGTTGTTGALASPARTTGTAGTTGRTATTGFTVQLAAYETRRDAEASVRRLKARGVDARVDGEARPFRVRVGRYDTRAAANAALNRLKKAGHKGFVAEITP
ncbi:MAG: SPOR domain-containing protein [Gemmatimonadetes bacterium]|nr:SPOR domain-containing protein [Gemmatimonadota bacterium]